MTWVQQLAQQLRVQVARIAGSVLGGPLGRVDTLLAQLSPLEAEVARVQRLSTPNHAYAYCFCTVE
jgi:hypothetical protein